METVKPHHEENKAFFVGAGTLVMLTFGFVCYVVHALWHISYFSNEILSFHLYFTIAIYQMSAIHDLVRVLSSSKGSLRIVSAYGLFLHSQSALFLFIYNFFNQL